ncbi:MAG TPA: hypothetical protein VIT38_10445 [Allosphingosinicella sp.]|jgi:hypothetical protein
MGIILAIALALTAGAGQAAAQAPAPSAPPAQQTEEQRWIFSDTQAALVPARIAFPRQAGTLTARRTQEFSHEGEGVDNALQYGSPDDAVFATVYVYYPGLPHAGLAAFATDEFIRVRETATRISTPMRLVPAGGIPDVAIRIDYANYRGMASSAAFMKAGRWLVKLRVSGPEARRAEVEAAMAALLQDMRFGAMNPAMAPHLISVSDCPADSGRVAARALPDPAGAEIAAHAFLATFDGGGNPATGEDGGRRDLPPRVPDRLCVTRLHIGDNVIPLLRGESGAAISVDGRTMAVAILSDNGNALEVVHAANLNRYVLLYHEIGGTSLLGGFDGVPSDAQITEILTGANREGTRVRVPVRFRPNRGPEMWLPSVAGASRPSATN